MTPRGIALLWLCLLGLPLAGCEDGIDRDQARLCRLSATALFGREASLTVARQRTVAAAEVGAPPDGTPIAVGEPGIRIDLDPGPGGGAHFVACAFGAGPARLALAAVATEHGPLSLPGLFALGRFWLGSAEAGLHDPQAISGADAALRLPAHTGYMLQQLVNALPSCAVYALLSVAYALVYGLIGRINLAFGAFAAIGGTAALMSVLALGRFGAAAALAAAALGALIPSAAYGIAVARLVFQPLRRATGQQTLVATIGLALVLGEYLRLVQGPEARWIGPILNTPVAVARDAAFTVTLTPIAALVTAVALGAGIGLTLAMRHSAFGRNWRAYRDDALAAALFGIGRDRLLSQTVAIASAFAGLAGGLTVVLYGDISFAYAQTLALKALTAAVLGGIGSVSGALFGGLFIGMVESGWSSSFPIVNRDLVTFCILIATLIWRPGGFFGDRDLVPRRF